MTEWPSYNSYAENTDSSFDLTSNQSRAAKDAFADWIWYYKASEE